MKQARNTCFHNQRGVSIVEFPLVFGLFAGLLVTFIDFARIFTTQAMLTRGAQQAVTLATKIQGFEFDNAWEDTADPQYATRLQRYRDARAAIAQQALLLPSIVANPVTMSIGSAAGTQNIVLLSFAALDEVGGALQQQGYSNVLVLRPGDSGIAFSSSSPDSGSPVVHILKCSSALTDCPAGKVRLTTDTMENMLQQYPIVVEMRALVHTYSPFLGPIVLRGTAMGYREQPVQDGEESGVYSPTDIDNGTYVPPGSNPNDCHIDQSDCGPAEEFDEVTCECYHEHTCSLNPSSCTGGLHFDADFCACVSSQGG